jgi:putative transposase
MTAPHLLNPARLLDQALPDASPDLMRRLLSTVINALLSAGGRCGVRRRVGPAVCRAGQPAQRVPAPRAGHPGGHRRRGGPEAASGVVLPEWLLERRKRAESALISVVVTCYLRGVSTRRMDKLVATLGITSLS